MNERRLACLRASVGDENEGGEESARSGGRTSVKRGEGEWSIDGACWRQCSLPLESGSEKSDCRGMKESRTRSVAIGKLVAWVDTLKEDKVTNMPN